MAFSNRAEAADRLAELLFPWQPEHPLVVALAPTGLDLALRIAHTLDTALDAIAVHELTAPGIPAGVLGAAAANGAVIVNPALAKTLGVGPHRLNLEAQRAATRSAALHRAIHDLLPAHQLAGQTALLVNDGVATGAADSLAITILRDQGVKQLVLAVPVGARAALQRLRPLVDALVCVREMPWPRPIDEWYDDYPEITDQRARRLLRYANGHECATEHADQSARHG